jgi:acyl carrier protein
LSYAFSVQTELEAKLFKTVTAILGAEAVFTPEQSIGDIPGWGSLNHARVLVAVERQFGFRLTAAEVVGVKCYADLIRLVRAKQSSHE